MPSRTSSRWVFTLNNPTEDEEQHVTDFLTGPLSKYGIFGREVGNSGTPHLQGFIILHRAQRRSFLRNNLNARAHYEVAHGTSVQARDYCKKDGDFEEFGTFPDNGGRRNDLDRLVEWIDDFTGTHNRPPTEREIACEQPAAFLRFPRFAALAALRAPPRAVESGAPLDWQRDLRDELLLDADDRVIRFVIDPAGQAGKSWFCRWMLGQSDKVQVLGVGRKDNIAYMIDESKSIFLFNVGRGQMKFLSTHLLEDMKDRMVISTKYASVFKQFPTNVHVVVFGNEPLEDRSVLTEDRIVETFLS